MKLIFPTNLFQMVGMAFIPDTKETVKTHRESDATPGWHISICSLDDVFLNGTWTS
jgi:hypothetical protein